MSSSPGPSDRGERVAATSVGASGARSNESGPELDAARGRPTFMERQVIRCWALLLVIAPGRMLDPTIDMCIEIAGRAEKIRRKRKENERALAA